jgi:hypothetical protein
LRFSHPNQFSYCPDVVCDSGSQMHLRNSKQPPPTVNTAR